MRWSWLFLLAPSALSAQAVVVTDSTVWVHAVAAGTPFNSSRVTLAPGQTLQVRYLMRDVRVHPPIDLSAGPGLWSVNDSAFVVTGSGPEAVLTLSPSAAPGDSARVFLTLSSPRATKVVPEIGAFLFMDSPVYECRGVSYPNLALWGWGDLVVHFQDGPRSFDCQAVAPLLTIQLVLTGPTGSNTYGVRVRVTDPDGQPVTDQLPVVTLLSGMWGDNSTTARACQSMVPDGCTPGNVRPGTVIRVTLDGAAAAERKAGG